MIVRFFATVACCSGIALSVLGATEQLSQPVEPVRITACRTEAVTLDRRGDRRLYAIVSFVVSEARPVREIDFAVNVGGTVRTFPAIGAFSPNVPIENLRLPVDVNHAAPAVAPDRTTPCVASIAKYADESPAPKTT